MSNFSQPLINTFSIFLLKLNSNYVAIRNALAGGVNLDRFIIF